jgi:sulfide:quinone oxidoreductase
MPKQAHMADLQAGTAVTNLLDELVGKVATATFKAELLCIIDSRDKGMLVARTEKRNFIVPPMLPLHWVKRFFEWMYLHKYK